MVPNLHPNHDNRRNQIFEKVYMHFLLQLLETSIRQSCYVLNEQRVNTYPRAFPEMLIPTGGEQQYTKTATHRRQTEVELKVWKPEIKKNLCLKVSHMVVATVSRSQRFTCPHEAGRIRSFRRRTCARFAAISSCCGLQQPAYFVQHLYLSGDNVEERQRVIYKGP